MDRQQAWLEKRRYTPEQLALARKVLEAVRSGEDLGQAVRRYPLPDGGHLAKHVLLYAYRELTRRGEWARDPALLRRIRLKPVRTLSGVTTVSVLTKPYPCPGTCLFCPDDARLPKSYLPEEPGAARALAHAFDPFEQTAGRVQTLEDIGHPTDKIELLILGGTWSAYEAEYQRWFVKRCLDALNGFEASSLEQAQAANEQADHKNVGLVIETRPDEVTPAELAHLRMLGVTKVQMGAQSLDDHILEINRRGHRVEHTRRAVRLLRSAGFKIVLHWMPNLLGATLQSDARDFARLWDDEDLRPDEIKIYPCQLLRNAPLYAYWEREEYTPYTTQQLVELLADLKPSIPRYCRVNRIVRDIPTTLVVAGNKRSSLRQDVQREVERRGEACSCIRCREVRAQPVEADQLQLEDLTYPAGGALEHFLSIVTSEDRLAAYVRLALPGPEAPDSGIPELQGAALIRDLHVYGQSLPVGSTKQGAAQHKGLGTRLVENAEGIARDKGFAKLAVIAALGTRGYYASLGYKLEGTYMVKPLA